jgi:hypothetical protein
MNRRIVIVTSSRLGKGSSMREAGADAKANEILAGLSDEDSVTPYYSTSSFVDSYGSPATQHSVLLFISSSDDTVEEPRPTQ